MQQVQIPESLTDEFNKKFMYKLLMIIGRPTASDSWQRN
jgi:hypothetical protein